MSENLGKTDITPHSQIINRAALISKDTLYINSISDYLESCEVVLTALPDYQSFISLNKLDPFDIVILELQRSDGNVFDFIRDISSTDMPIGILILSSYAEEIDRVIALEMGADDVITKSTTLREILAHIRAIIRRYNMVRSIQSINQELLNSTRQFKGNISYNGWDLDLFYSNITAPNGKSVTLSRMELQILAMLLASPETVFSRSDLLSTLKGDGANVSPRQIDTVITRIRRKLKLNDDHVSLMTASGIGYYWK